METAWSINITLLIVVMVLVSSGIYLVLEKNLTRVLLGIILLTNGANLLILTFGGKAGPSPLYDPELKAWEYNDPLPQALILTSIVISLGVTALMLGIIYRGWNIARQDNIQDDSADRQVIEQDIYDTEEDFYVPYEKSEFDDDKSDAEDLDGLVSSDGDGTIETRSSTYG